MSVFVDRRFLLELSPKLPRFVKKKDDLYNFRCPLCGDSQKNKTKSRGYVYRKKNDYFYMCHNCGASTSFYNFLKQVDPNLCEEYSLERYKQSANTNSPKPEFTETKSLPVFKKQINLHKIDKLEDGHFAKEYVVGRKIPEEFYGDLYYAEDFKKFVEDIGIEKDGLIDDDKRLVIPFYDKDRNLTGIQGRSLSQSKLRYITIKVQDDVPRVFGLDRVNVDEKIYVFEGPIDSMFIKNSVAIASSALESAAEHLDKSKLVLVFDNEPRNKEIVKLMEHAIDNHFNVVIWPEMIKEKDVNEMILHGFDKEELCDIIEKHSYINLRAKMEFINWKKV
jgi:transcription elongation factor Elf1